MNACPSCGGELIFDIATQSLRCPFCDQKRDPKKYTAFGAAADEHFATEMDAILYTCPQCGGSIYSTDHSINGFCSYCGSQVTLQSRTTKMKYPKYVIPFRIDKDTCIENYRKYVKKAIFAPDALKNDAYCDRFRGIYISYWGYDITQEGFISLEGMREGDKYKCMGWLTAVFNNIFFDGSSVFEDRYSEQIAPFNYSAKVDFTPAYLSGFYADLPDLPDDVYEEEAIQIAKEKSYEPSRLRRFFPKTSFDMMQKEKYDSVLDSFCSATYITLFPVWFLSWREKDRVSYAVVNGETGRVAGDLPVDFKKFILSGCVIAVPIVFLLCVLPAFSKTAILIASEVFSLFSIWLMMYMIEKVVAKKEMIYDKGFLVKTDQLNYKYRLNANKEQRIQKAIKTGIVPVVVAALLIGIPVLFRFFSILTGSYAVLVAFAIGVVTEIILLNDTVRIVRLPIKKKPVLLLGLWIIFGAALYGIYLIMNHSEHLDRMYLAVFWQLVGTLIAQFMTLDQYNILATRPFAQLNRMGGERNG